jgi:hypothetical protein
MSQKKSSSEPASAEERQKRIGRLVMKIEVYLSYSLYTQATEAIDEILELDPEHLEGHRSRLEVLEATAEREDVARQLVVLAHLCSQEPAVANSYLKRARQILEDDELRAIAARRGLELNRVMRVGDTSEFTDAPQRWPFVADETSRRNWLLRRLSNPSELHLESCSPAGSEEVEHLVCALSNAATTVPASDEVRAALFIDDQNTYAIFTNRDFVAVHEVPAHALGRVVSRYKRTSLDVEQA